MRWICSLLVVGLVVFVGRAEENAKECYGKPLFCVVQSIDSEEVHLRELDTAAKTSHSIPTRYLIATEANGKTLPPETWKQRLVAGTKVMLSSNGKPLSPAVRAMLKPTTVAIWKRQAEGNLTLYLPKVDPSRPGKVVFTWKSGGDGLREDSVRLTYSESKEGLYLRIGEKLPNTGELSWRVPAKLPENVYLQAEIQEWSGTTLRLITPNPLSLSELRKVSLQPKK
jgi:hypothetical protein